MRKTLWFLLLFLPFSGLSFGQTVQQWKVIKVVTVTGKTNIFPPVTVFTPTATRTYRVSATFVQDDVSGAGSKWTAAFLWTDQLGAGGVAGLTVGTWSGTTFMFNPKVGTPFTYDINQAELSFDQYRLMFTVEQLQ